MTDDDRTYLDVEVPSDEAAASTATVALTPCPICGQVGCGAPDEELFAW